MSTRITSRGTQANVIDSDLDSVHEIYLEYRAIIDSMINMMIKPQISTGSNVTESCDQSRRGFELKRF